MCLTGYDCGERKRRLRPVTCVTMVITVKSEKVDSMQPCVSLVLAFKSEKVYHVQSYVTLVLAV